MGLSKVFLHKKGYYIFKFLSIADRDNVLASGPWHFSSKVIVLQPWQEGIEFSKSECVKFPIWVKLSQIPLSYWSDEGISYLASAIGKPLFTDEMTSKNELMNFARVCVEVKATFSFPSSINAVVWNDAISENITVPVEVEYQGRPPSCPSCKVFGHSPLKCPKANYQWIPKAQPPSDSGGLKSNPVLPTPPMVGSGSPNLSSSLTAAMHTDASAPPNEWVTVSRGAKSGMVSPVLPSKMTTSNSFSPIATSPGTQTLPGLVSPFATSGVLPLSPDTASPALDNPLVTKLKVIDEKEGKDLKQKQRNGNVNPQVAKKRSKGKGKAGNTSPTS